MNKTSNRSINYDANHGNWRGVDSRGTKEEEIVEGLARTADPLAKFVKELVTQWPIAILNIIKHTWDQYLSQAKMHKDTTYLATPGVVNNQNWYMTVEQVTM